ncbi:4913_t:CDS:2 [Acaulospora morrowiae]|uniref:4913_t:CDS:1 n=1 Tax=Acaulospora morrowiae TaxID=94023 RepID=A0A9N8WBE0_9GLOM|nr:4913_t:CDS:2 [Acaulospora morrowiae]
MGNSSSKRKSAIVNNYMDFFSAKDPSLPTDERMQLGSHIIRELWGENFSSPIKDLLKKGGATVLDVGCGTGTWMFDLAADYQKSSYVGVDMVRLFPAGTEPFNVKFVNGNVLNGLPFEDGTFDFVHVQFLVFDIKEADWESIVYKELVRVLKPGGWLEISEPEFRCSKVGEVTQKFITAGTKRFSSMGVNIHIASRHLEIMSGISELTSIHHQERGYPLNKWQGKLAETGRKYMRETCGNLMQNIHGDMKIKKKKIDEMMDEMVEEWKVYEPFINIHRFFGRKLM